MYIKLNNICKAFNNKTVLKDISMGITKGEFVLIRGESGSGKTTLLNIIGGLEEASEGEVFFDGQLIDSPRSRTKLRRELVSFIFQNYGLIDNESVKENLLIVLSKEKKKRVDFEAVLRQVNLNPDILNQKVCELSGGEQQRVSIARALLKGSPVLLADEPTGNLDSLNAKEIFRIFKNLNAQGRTIICVSHESKIDQPFDRIFQLKNGVFVN